MCFSSRLVSGKIQPDSFKEYGGAIDSEAGMRENIGLPYLFSEPGDVFHFGCRNWSSLQQRPL